MAASSPLKPWQMKNGTGSLSSSQLKISSTVANGRTQDNGSSLVTPQNTPTPPLNGVQASSSQSNALSPSIPPRPSNFGNNNGVGGYGYGSSSVSGYSRYGGVGMNSYGNSGYGGSYGSSYGGGYGSSYGAGGYGNRYSSYGSGYGGVGSSYGGYSRYGSSGYGGVGMGGYGSSYGGYGSYGGNNLQDGMNTNNSGYFRNALDSGASQLSKFGQMAEGISVFSRLIDANFDAMHSSFQSVLRFIDVFGEFFYVVKTFAFFRVLTKIVNWMIGRNNRITSSNNSSTTNRLEHKITPPGTSILSAADLNKFNSPSSKSKLFPFLFIILGCTVIGIPMFLAKLWKRLSERNNLLNNTGIIDNKIWDDYDPLNTTSGSSSSSEELNARPVLVRALYDFNGNIPVELNFRKNDIIKVVNKIPSSEWSEGEFNGHRGLFPQNYVEIFEAEK